MKRIFSLLLSITMLAALGTGCAQTPKPSQSDEPTVTTKPLKAVNGTVTKAGFLAELASADGTDLSSYEGKSLPFAD